MSERIRPIDPDRCEFIRWKGMFIESIEDVNSTYSPDRVYWCQKTQICLGPDGQGVDEYECNETRGCYRAL